MSDSCDDNFPVRKNPAAGVHINLAQSNVVLLTVNTKNRQTWLANENSHRLLRQTWFEARAWMVSDYLLMPDHLHCFCAPHDLTFEIETWIAYWKRLFAIKCRELPERFDVSTWKFQPRGWHHRLRDGENYSEKWLYVQENPVRKHRRLALQREDF